MRKIVFLVISLPFLWFGADIIAHAQSNPQSNLPPAIIEFTSDVQSVDLAALEREGVPLIFSWKTVNLSEFYVIQIEQYHLNDWVVVAGGTDILPTNGSQNILATHPQNFTSPTYRLVIRNEHNVILTQRMLVIPYSGNTFQPPVFIGGTCKIRSRGLPLIGELTIACPIPIWYLSKLVQLMKL